MSERMDPVVRCRVMTRDFLCSAVVALTACGGGMTGAPNDDAPVDATTGDVWEEEDSTGPGPEPEPEPPTRCGDGVVDTGESCDLGIGNQAGVQCTEACELPQCGDQQLMPPESCDGPAIAAGEDVGPWSCGEDCLWRTPTEWIDWWSDHEGHDDAVLQIDTVADGSVRALGWQDGAAGPRWILRAIESEGIESEGEEGGTRSWTQELGAAACEARQPWLAVSADLTAVLTFSCRENTTTVQVFDGSGEPTWSVAEENTDLAGGGLWGSGAGFAVYSASLTGGSASLSLRFLDPNGELSWDVEVANPVWASASDDTTLYGAGPETVWSRRLSDGVLLESTPLRSRAVAATIDGSGRLVVARRPSNAMEPFVLQQFDGALDALWTVELGEVANTTWRRFGVDAGAGRIVLALEGQDPDLGSFDTHASVLTFDEAGTPLGSLALQGPGHSRDFALDVATTSSGAILAAGALSQAGSGFDGFVARLDESLSGESPNSVPIPTPRRQPSEPTRPAAAVPKTVFVDTSGPALRPGSDPSLAEVSCIDGAFGFPALSWDPSEVQQAIAEAEAITQPFAVRFVATPPPSYLPHTRVLLGGAPASLGSGDGQLGLACVIDCGDATWTESVFVFGETASSPEGLAQTIVHELGHAIGLDHIDASGDLMNPISSAQNTTIEDACRPLTQNSCASEHASHCGSDRQNSHAEFLAAVGPAPTDVDPPSITIAAPSSVAPRVAVGIVVEVSDATPGFGWQLSVPELGWRSPGSTERDGTFELHLPQGRWTVEVEATDQLGNTSTQSAELTVES